jgi:hypothetical protein
MTLNELLANRSVIDGDAADVAFELWQGERPVEIHDNNADDWEEKPVLLVVDGQTIRLSANQADAIRAAIDFSLQEYGSKLAYERAKVSAEMIGDNPLEVA